MDNTNIYIWKINIITNKNNKKKIVIKNEDMCVNNAKRNILNDILKLSRFGIPCYMFDSKTKKYNLTYLDEYSKCDEYYIITIDFLQHFSKEPNEIKKKHNTKQLSANAEPFIPNMIYSNMYVNPFVPGTNYYPMNPQISYL